MTSNGYARAEVLVNTDWVEAHRNDNNVCNYDGSWTEWGSLIGVLLER